MESMTSSTNARLDGRASARSARRYWRRQFDDTELIDKIGELSAACMVVSKKGRKPREASKLQPLDALNKRTPGMPVKAFLALTDLARRRWEAQGCRSVVLPGLRRTDPHDPYARLPKGS